MAFSHFKKLDLVDALIATGIVLVTAGVWQIYPPAAYIVAGSALFGLGVAALRGGKSNPWAK